MKKFIQLWLPVLLWAGIIFYSSAQPYGNQDMRPTFSQYVNEPFVENTFSWVTFNYVDHEVSIANLGVAGFLEFFVRKGAHFFVYFVLCILLLRAIRGHGVSGKKAALLALLGTALYAGSDEIHQSFTKDRTPLWQDSLLDTVGGAFGLLTVWLASRRRK